STGSFSPYGALPEPLPSRRTDRARADDTLQPSGSSRPLAKHDRQAGEWWTDFQSVRRSPDGLEIRPTSFEPVSMGLPGRGFMTQPVNNHLRSIKLSFLAALALAVVALVWAYWTTLGEMA